MKFRVLVLSLVAASATSIASPARGDTGALDACEAWVVREAAVQRDLAAIACDALGRAAAKEGLTDVPTLLMAWPGAGVLKEGGGVGYPVSGVCVLAGAFISPNQVQYVLVGVGISVGPATETRIACGAGPLYAEGELIGPVAVAVATETAPLQAMSVCTAVVGKFLDGSVTRSRTPAGCSPRPSF